MTAKTTTERVRAYRARKRAAGLAEVRGVYAPLAQHEGLKRQITGAINAVDCRTCRHYVGLGDPCLSTAKCDDARQYAPLWPVQMWGWKR